MASASPHTVPTGIFGKIPSKGDFVSRSLPRVLTDRLDHWVRAGMALARQNPNWHEAYLSSPIWQFAVARGVIDSHPWCGVIMPSVDAVGRNFPLVLTLPTDGASTSFLLGLQSHALAALSADNFSLDDWTAGIADLGSPLQGGPSLSAPASGIVLRVMSPAGQELIRQTAPDISPDIFVRMISSEPDANFREVNR